MTRFSSAERRVIGALVVAVPIGMVAAGLFMPNGVPVGVVLLGLVLGGLDALTALGLVLIFRAARIVNFGQAEMGGLAAGLAIAMVGGWKLPYALAVVVGILAALATGWVIAAVVVDRFFNAARLILTVATVGVAQVLGSAQLALPSLFSDLDLPTATLDSPFDFSTRVGPLVFTGDHFVALAMVPVILASIALFLSRTRYGIAIRAAADSSERALLLGVPVRTLSHLTWTIAAGLSGVASILRAPIAGSNLGSISGVRSLMLPLAAAVIAGMERPVVAVAAALGLGVTRQVIFWNFPRSSSVDVVLFVLILAALLLRRRGRERVSRGAEDLTVDRVRAVPAELARVPAVRVARRAAPLLLIGAAVGIPAFLGESRLVFVSNLVAFSILAVSLVVLTGWAGQVSLGQFAFAGVGGALTGALLVRAGWDLFIALGVGSVAAGLAAVLVGLPALRIPGLFFGVTTLALAVPVSTFLLNETYFPWLAPGEVPRPVLLDRFSLDQPLRWYYFSFALLLIVIALARDFRNSRAGRVLLATRDNDHAAASYGISPERTRLVAFALSGALAGLGGGIYVVSLRSVPFGGFSPEASLQIFTMAVIGGLGSIPGAILGAAYVWSAEFFLRGAAQLLATGAGLLLLLYLVPGGLASILYSARDRVLKFIAEKTAGPVLLPSDREQQLVHSGSRSTPKTNNATLAAVDIEAGYAGVPVLFGVSLDVQPGEAVALVGTNGAGKSTLFRVLAGTLPSSSGTVLLQGDDITSLSPIDRVRKGIVMVPGGRGVFPSLTVAEHLRVARWTKRNDPDFLDAETERVLQLFPVLRDRLDSRAQFLSGGEQQMLAIGMSMLCRPSVLLVDELSLGLAPVVVALLIEVLGQLAKQGVSVIVVEQSLNIAVRATERAVFLERGVARFSGRSADLMKQRALLRSVFLGDGRRTPARPGSPNGKRRDRTRALEVVDLDLHYGGITALDQVSVGVAPGEILGVIGPNGAGKTTLLDVCSGYVLADAGRVLIGGQDVTADSAHARACMGVGRLFQDARLYPGLSVRETIAVAFERSASVRDPIACMLRLQDLEISERQIFSQVDALIERMGLIDYRDSSISELSTGTRRVVELACQLAHEPSVVLLDEPSSGIAQKETEALAGLLLDLRDQTGAAFVVIEHDVPMISSISDRLVCMHLGQILAEGKPSQVLAARSVVSAYLGSDESAIARSGSTKRRPRQSAKMRQ